MLLNFEASNVLCFQNAVEFSMVSKDSTDENLQPLNVAAVFGANNHGKTSLFRSVGTLKDCVLTGSILPVVPFNTSRDTTLEVVFRHLGVDYQYGLHLNTESILEEWLFSGDTLIFQVVTETTGERVCETSLTVPLTEWPCGQLLLSYLNYHEVIAPVYSWFEDVLVTQAPTFGSVQDACVNDPKLATFVQKFLEASDVAENSIFVESSSVQQLSNLAYLLYKATKENKVIFLDGFDVGLHLNLSLEIVRWFTRHVNTNSQFVFSTHNTLLLDYLRRDSIWFVKKDSLGDSSLYSLLEFKKRESQTVSKDYLQGRFDGVPFLNFDSLTSD